MATKREIEKTLGETNHTIAERNIVDLKDARIELETKPANHITDLGSAYKTAKFSHTDPDGKVYDKVPDEKHLPASTIDKKIPPKENLPDVDIDGTGKPHQNIPDENVYTTITSKPKIFADENIYFQTNKDNNPV